MSCILDYSAAKTTNFPSVCTGYLVSFLHYHINIGIQVSGRLPFSIKPQTDDEKFMLEALKEAWKAYQLDEVPVGAVLVKEGRIIARGHNQVEMLKDATAHAEMLCITAGEIAMENWRLTDTSLFCTIEPCCMCAGAMLLSRVSNLIWGAPDLRHGANGSWVDLFEKPHPTHSMDIRTGVLQEYCGMLMQDFFQKKRKQKSNGEI